MRQALLFLLVLALAVNWFRSDQILRLLSLIKPDIGQRPSKIYPEQNNSDSLAMAVYDHFMLFGDSLIQHSSSQERGFALTPALQAEQLSWSTLGTEQEDIVGGICNEYIRRLDVVNRGFSGYNTDQALKMISAIMPSPEQAKVRFLLILFGANDACLEGAQGGQHVPLDKFKENLVNIISHSAVKRQNPRIILVTTPPMNEYLAEESDRMKGITEPRRSADHTRLYAEAVKEISKTQDVVLLDLWKLFMTHAGWKEGQYPIPGSKKIAPNPFMRMLLHDGLHFTGLAYTLFQQEVMRVIANNWPDQMPEKLPFVLPVWNEPTQWKNWES